MRGNCRMKLTEKEKVEKWKHEFAVAQSEGREEWAHFYLDKLFDWLISRGVEVLSDDEFENLRTFISMNDYV